MGQLIGAAVIGEDNWAMSWDHAKLIQIGLHCRCQHYSWPVIIVENKITLNCASGNNDMTCPRFPSPLKHMRLGGGSFSDHKQIILTIAPDGGLLKMGDFWVSIKLRNDSRDPVHCWPAIYLGLAFPQISPGMGIVIDNHHTGTAAAGNKRRQQPTRPTADNQNIAIPVPCFKMLIWNSVIRSRCKASRPTD